MSVNGLVDGNTNVAPLAGRAVNASDRFGPPPSPPDAPLSGSKLAAPPATPHSSPLSQPELLPVTTVNAYFAPGVHGTSGMNAIVRSWCVSVPGTTPGHAPGPSSCAMRTLPP